jgi:hypothetical protein
MTGQHVRTAHLNRSAVAYTTAENTTIYMGFCKQHQVPVREDMLGSEPDLAPQFAQILCFADPANEHEIQGERLVAIQTTVECDGSCTSARFRACSCGCGGVNHGIHWSRGFMLENREVFESELAQLRATQAKNQEARTARREAQARRVRSEFDTWAQAHSEVIEALEPYREDFTNDFLRDLALQAASGRPLSPAQETAALRAIARRDASHDRAAEREAAKRPAPLGSSIAVSGKVIKVKVREGYMSPTEESIIVRCDGYAVQVKLPAAVRRWVMNSRPEVFCGQKFSCKPDYGDLAGRWGRALKGMKISFTAGEVALGSKSADSSFAYAKRATRVEFTPPPVDDDTDG